MIKEHILSFTFDYGQHRLLIPILFLTGFIFLVYRYLNKYKWIILTITLPVLLFVNLAEGLVEKELSVFDNWVYGFIIQYISEDMTEFMKFITFLGSGMAMAGITVIVLVVLWKNKKFSFYGWMVLANLTASVLLNQIFKLLFHRPRPNVLRFVEIGGYSFPSGHSMAGISFYGFFIFLCLKYLKDRSKYGIAGALGLLVMAIGISRIYLGVHYASDVLAGFSAGLAWLAVFIAITKRIYPPKTEG